MNILAFLGGLAVYAFVKIAVRGFYTVRPDQRAVKTSFGRAERLPGSREEDASLNESETAKKVSQKLAEASAARPAIVGETLNEIGGADPEILDSVIDVMQTEKLLESGASVEVLPEGASVLLSLGDTSAPRLKAPGGS